MSTQLYKPLISENQRDEDDIKHFYNPDLGSSFHHHDYLQINPHGYDDHVDLKREWNADNTEWDHQLFQPLNLPNQVDHDDIKNYYVPNRNNSYGMY